MSLRVAILGCGVGGLTAALLCHRDGHRVTLFERFESPQPIGSGLVLQPTGLAVLRALGLDEGVQRQGANMAMLDAYALASALRSTRDVAAALDRAVALRRFHVRLYQALSALFTPVYQSDSRVLPLLRDRLVGPLAKLWPAPVILATIVSGRLADPHRALGLERGRIAGR